MNISFVTFWDEGGMKCRNFGRMEEFSPESETITSYLERTQLFLVANDPQSVRLLS